MLAGSLAADQLAIGHHDFTAYQRSHRPTGDPKALIGRVVGSMMQDILADRNLARWIPDRNVCVRADHDRALARIEAVGLGCARRISSIAWRLETWTIITGTSINSARAMVRWVASLERGLCHAERHPASERARTFLDQILH
jgi:hypothetical protein